MKFHVETDHKPLIHALHRLSTPWSARQTRHLPYIAEYTSDIRHISDTDNVMADTGRVYIRSDTFLILTM